MKEIDPVSYDIMASSAVALSTYNDLKLTSTSLGSFSKFKIRLEDAIEDLIANEIPGGTNDRYLITNLMGKLPALGYQQILMQQDTLFTNLTFQETLQPAILIVFEVKSWSNFIESLFLSACIL